MVCKKAKKLLERRERDEAQREQNKIDYEQNKKISIDYLSQGICPHCGCTNIIHIFIKHFFGDDDLPMNKFKLICERCRIYAIINKNKWQCERNGPPYHKGGVINTIFHEIGMGFSPTRCLNYGYLKEAWTT